MNAQFLPIQNAEAIRRDQLPSPGFDEFRRSALEIVESGGKVVQFFSYASAGKIHAIAVLRKDETLLASGCELPETYPSLTAVCEPFHIFEREIAEQYGIVPEGHPWLKMVRYHPNYTGRPDVFGNDYTEDIPGRYDYYKVAGEEIHEVAVGPVHAGVIEPGHFRFNCIGERVLHLEIQLGYQHRGIEPMLPAVNAARRAVMAEGIAGDTAVGHSVCYAQAVEALASITPDSGSGIIRTLGLELERLANHIGDLGALSADVAFLPPANYFGRIRGDFLNMSLFLCGNRMGKGLVRPGGVRFQLPDASRATLIERLSEISPQVIHVLDLIFTTPSVRSRFEQCGEVKTADAEKLGLVGPAGRASGIPYDARRCFPTERYRRLDIPENAEPSGDVYARAKVRADEVVQSMDIVRTLLSGPVETTPVDGVEDMKLAPDAFVVTVNEAWRGELSHAILTDESGGILRYKVKDPSFHNWNGLGLALRDTGISDFPLNNKSFNLSYCGYDL